MHIRLRRLAEYALVAAVGGVGYYTLETLWRGWSHWSMALAGGLCLLLYYPLCTGRARPQLLLALIGAAIITAIEFCVGMIVNVALGLGVWDYSALPLNLWGQISLLYSSLWFLLCIPMTWLCRSLRRHVFSTGE